jgi:histidyl-tRNA synthetase
MVLTAVRGFRDALPVAARLLSRIENAAVAVLERHGYAELRVPILERTEVFVRSLGESTDIVEKEMYTFEDRDGTLVTLRPEGTAPVVRAFVEHHLDQQDPVARLYYLGPMFRRERPQKGRHRQFHQIGVELFGREDALADAEVIALLHDILKEIGISSARIRLNSLGDAACRPAYRELLRAFGEAHRAELCASCQGRIERNPLRILDCKEPGCRAATADAPALIDHLCDPCREHFGRVRALLDDLGVPYEIDHRLVRGLDYYVRTAFEVVAAGLGAQEAVGGGGRYDGLVAELGGPPISAIGFALGVERLVLALEAGRPEAPAEAEASLKPQVFVAPLGAAAEGEALRLAGRLRALGVRVEVDGGRSLKSLMRRADRRGAPRVLILGDEEVAARRATIRDMEAKRDAKLAVDLDLTGPELLDAVGVAGARS